MISRPVSHLSDGPGSMLLAMEPQTASTIGQLAFSLRKSVEVGLLGLHEHAVGHTGSMASRYAWDVLLKVPF